MNVSRKRKKQLRKLQKDAGRLWESQQDVVGHAADIAREAGRQLGHFNREQVVPAVQHSYGRHLAPTVERGVKVGRHVVDDKVVPIVGGVVGSALSAWDVANAKRNGALGNPPKQLKQWDKKLKKKQKKGMGLGSVIALVLGIAAAVGVAVAAWQTLRADDELWVADDPLSTPDA